MQKIDFYVEFVDNFGDLGFAYNLALNLLKIKKDLKINFFSNNKNLFLNLSGGKSNSNIEYFDIKEIKKLNPSETIINFFDRKIDFDYLNSFSLEIKLINFGYFSIHKGVENLHLTSYSKKNIYITHFIPSILPNTGGVILNQIKKQTKKEIYPGLSEIFYNKKWCSVFVYPETFYEIKDELLSRNDYLFFVFDERNEVSGENIICMPFLKLEKYYDFLGVCDKNIVRGENSLVGALVSKKPFLWDIYKEHNNAHSYKIDDFGNFLGNNDFKEILKTFNLKDKNKGLEEFFDFENNDFFQEKGDYVIKNCDLVKNLEKLI